ncbi:MAG: ribosome biogenesis GTP-binding protein YihA/YsxC [Pseudomonadota bacterium]
MIITSAEFITSAVKPGQYPPPDFPEIAFSGRSNVGKSSLINTLVNRKHLVKTSRTPGRTQLINFFLINNAFSFVDLPGYGYARVPNAVKKTWKPMIENYLTLRMNLKGIVSLLDIRRTPGPEERDLMGWLEKNRIPCVWVLTKADKFSKTKQKSRQLAIGDAMGLSPGELILFSAKTRLGRDGVWAALKSLCSGEPESPAGEPADPIARVDDKE